MSYASKALWNCRWLYAEPSFEIPKREREQREGSRLERVGFVIKGGFVNHSFFFNFFG